MGLDLRSVYVTGALMLLPLCVAAQQVSDDSFRLNNPDPAFSTGEGPQVCIDEAHYNFHTVDGRDKPFAELLRGDGYSVMGFASSFTRAALVDCQLLVIANPLAAENQEDWTYPHPSAFTKDEIRELMEWVRGGGRLLLFADHAPIAGAARDLGAVFGIVMMDVYANGGPGPDVFRTSDGTLQPHPILRGRSRVEQIDSVMTFIGQAVQITQGWESLLIFGTDAVAKISLEQSFQEGSWGEWPVFSVAGWVHGAVREWGEGRVVFLGEAAMCSAQVSGAERNPMGMNDPRASQNAQFCLNVVRWLTGVLDR